MKETQANEMFSGAMPGYARNAETAPMSGDAGTDDLATHVADDTRHKTAEEQGKLDNLATDANATYAAKSVVDDCTPIVFQATYTDDADGKRDYTISIDQRPKAVDYFENNRFNPVLLVTTSAIDATQYETYVMTVKKHVGIERALVFYRVDSPVDNTSTHSIHQLSLRYSHSSNGSITGWTLLPVTKLAPIPYEYYADKYMPAASFNMDDFTESGGVYAATSDAIVGTNLPEGFTKISGYVLASLNKVGLCCTQVITDAILKKTMIRSKVMLSSSFEWTPWKQIDGDAQSEMIQFTATYDTVNDVNTYTLDSGQDVKFIKYFEENKTNPVELICTPNDSTQPVIKCVLDRKRIIGNTYRMNFNSINSSNIEQFELRITMIPPDDWNHLTLSCSKLPLEASEYKYARYSPLESFDMNDWIDSGGISAIIDTDVVGTNIPAGFTEFYGFVLKNDGYSTPRTRCCTQVVTDKVLKITMMRQAMPTDNKSIEWTPWKQIGAQTPGVYVVADYPTDLSGYMDGSIFIKEQL